VSSQRLERRVTARLALSVQLLIGLTLGAIVLSSSLSLRDLRASQGSRRGAADELLLVSRLEVTRLLTLGYDQVAADLQWLRAIQYFARHLVSDRRYPLLEPLVEQIFSLDPDFKEPYFWAGSSVLYGREISPARVYRANKIYERAMARFPDDYEPPYRLGMNFYTELRSEDDEQRARDQELGLRYLQRAANAPNAPSTIRELVRGIAQRMGRDEVLFHALSDELIQTSEPTRRAQLEERLEALMLKMSASGELRGLVERAEAQERWRQASLPYLSPLLFDELLR